MSCVMQYERQPKYVHIYQCHLGHSAAVCLQELITRSIDATVRHASFLS